MNARAIFVGGGNTFVLLNKLRESGLLTTIKNAVENGISYIGLSAGSNIACPTIKTTNDMPADSGLVFRLDALGLVPFQINPHYFSPEEGSTFAGETRDERILEYLAYNEIPVVGLRGSSMMRVEGDEAVLKGPQGARVFIRGREPKEYPDGSSLSFLLSSKR